MSTLLDYQMSRIATEHAATRTPRVLCIDDDPDIHTSIELALGRYDVAVEHSYYGMQGIVDALGQGPDLIISDVAMPNGDGRYLVENLRRNTATAQTPIIVLSGMRDPAIRSRLLRDGVNAFLPKPVRSTELIRQISEFIELRERDDR
ncbi:Sensor histidine kinase TodS [Posidoniimonas corsicana]|uniref:Sensor histidine kinase TodS n=2 Tax=Posidoniimonas corsicana TaxID=1938618 RepID=A0A5C5VFY3_9BACT|nr:Sensor histidine kinase TodS [Posidoniimonas corsicana]